MSDTTIGSRFKSLSIKVPVLMVGLAAFAILTVGTLAYAISQSTVEREARERLGTVLETRTRAIETWFGNQIVDLQALAGNPATSGALVNLGLGWNDLGFDDAARRAYLHDHYIDGNAHPAGERNKLEQARDGSTYSETHAIYHAGFDQFRLAKGLYDIFLIDRTGNIVYTVFKEDDLGENLVSGRLADSGLGRAARDILQDPEPGRVAFTDFAPYAPSYGAPASFIAAPLYNRAGAMVGVLAFQLPIDLLNAVMRDPTGLGDTGQAYIVGGDGLMRSAARFTGDDTILARSVDGTVIAAARGGDLANGRSIGLNGKPVEMAAKAMQVGGETFVVAVEQDISELRAPIADLARKMVVGALAALAVVSVMCVLFARSISRPLVGLVGGIRALAERDWNVQFTAVNRGDEIGTIARGLKQLRYDLQEFDASAQDALFKSSALGRTSSGVMIADAEFNITYANDAVKRMIDDNLAAFREISPDISAATIVGQCMDVFHKAPQRIREVLKTPGRLPMKADIPLGGLTFALDISNVTDAQGATVGYVVEWADATAARRNEEVVSRLRAAFTKLSEGDLTVALPDGVDGEFAQLRDDFNDAIRKLGDAISTVIDTSVLIKGEAHEISNAADDLARRTEQQAATLEQTAAALDQLTSSVNSAAGSAKEASRMVSAARDEAETSGQVVREAVSAMHQIDESSTQVTQIISVIEEIAFQTNLLALNAGVEAARAGEAGRGFAVVASEVRALARRASDAAKEIGGLIQGSTQQVKRGVTLVEKAGEALGRIVGSVKDIDGSVSEIAQSSQEQASGLGEINIAVNQLDQVTQQNAAMFEQMSAASQSLNTESQTLLDRTQAFTIATPKGKPEAANAGKAPKQAFSSVRKTAATAPAGGGKAVAAPPPAPAPRPGKLAVAAGAAAAQARPAEDDWDEF